METVEAQALLAPETANMLIILSLALNLVLLVGFAFLWATRRRELEVSKLENSIQKLSNNVKRLEKRIEEKNPRVVHTLPDIKPFGMGFDEESVEERKSAQEATAEGNDEYASLWEKFIADYNLLAGSMNVPRQLEACEKFVYDNSLRMLLYGGAMNFLPAIEVSESNYWAWKIPDTKNIYAIVPNPMRPCDKVVYESGGLRQIFDMDYNGGVFRKYIIERPATFVSVSGWQLQERGRLELEKE
ncbi:MAG: hypothetical protein J5809_03260 [Selenomonadaceae bacterium]|nr:hypothetical protein [Selenomonadaceae bacterium]